MLTKDDLKNFATKDDFMQLSKKIDDLTSEVVSVLMHVNKMSELTERVQNLENRIDSSL